MIRVLAGVNGAGKSSIGGSAIRSAGQDWYNPDELARAMLAEYPQRSIEEINGAVWREGLRRLQRAIRDDTDFSFETTLGGASITNALLDAIAAGVGVNIWYCGLESIELHLQRVADRVTRGGHDIPEAMVRARFRSSIRNLCRLAHGLNQLGVYDNSLPLDKNGLPQIRRLLFVRNRQVRFVDPDMPEWAKPVAAVCLASG